MSKKQSEEIDRIVEEEATNWCREVATEGPPLSADEYDSLCLHIKAACEKAVKSKIDELKYQSRRVRNYSNPEEVVEAIPLHFIDDDKEQSTVTSPDTAGKPKSKYGTLRKCAKCGQYFLGTGWYCQTHRKPDSDSTGQFTGEKLREVWLQLEGEGSLDLGWNELEAWEKFARAINETIRRVAAHPSGGEKWTVEQDGNSITEEGIPICCIYSNGIGIGFATKPNAEAIADAHNSSVAHRDTNSPTDTDRLDALHLLLASHGCLTEGNPEIPEEISAQFDVTLHEARMIHDAAMNNKP